MGYVENSFGELAEHLVIPGIVDKFNDLGFDFTKWGQNIKIKDSVSRNTIAEIDILLENSEAAIAVEVKAKLRRDDIEYFIEKMDKLRQYADKHQDKRTYHGAIAAAIMGDDLRREILREGVYAIEQTGDTMKITIPEGFTPRGW
jgi:hypothetical protein